MMNFREKISGFFWLVVAILVCFEAVRIDIGTFENPGSGFLPFLAAIVLGTLAITVIISDIVRRDKVGNLSELSKEKSWIRPVLVIIALLLYSIFLPILGYLIMTFVLMVFLFGLLGRPKLWIQLMGGFIASLSTYILFHILLKVELPRGSLGF